MRAEPVQRLEEGPHGKGCGDEGNAEAERIDKEQKNALAYRVFACGHEQDCGEYRPNAGRPAEGEGEADEVGAEKPGRTRIGVGARLAMQEGNVDHAQKVQSGDDDDDAGDLAEQVEILNEQLTSNGCRGTEDHEHGGEAKHEGER